MPLSVDEFLARINAKYVTQLVTALPGGGVDASRVQRALDDAQGELDAYIPRLPAALRPTSATLTVHLTKVALYLLTLDRPAKEFEQIRNAYTDTIAFYKDAISAAAAGSNGAGGSPIDGTGCSPPELMTQDALRGFGGRWP